MRREDKLRDDLLREAREFDDNIADDWLGPFFVRAFGKSRFTLGEIMDGGRAHRLTYEAVMAAYFEYQWDEEIGSRRELQAVREDAQQQAIDYVGGHYDLFLEMFANGENLYEIEIEYDANMYRERTRRTR